jgi:predicted N-acyltransferase
VLARRGEPVAAAPAFVKTHSQGEFVFDHAWAEAARRGGLRYYPKLLVGVPFTPVTGPRLLVSPEAGPEEQAALREALARALVGFAESAGLSGVHVNFLQEEELEPLLEAGFLHRLGLQYHWSRGEARSFDDYLAQFNSKKRNQLKRERREPAAQGLELCTLRGEALAGHAEVAFRLYLSTVEKFSWGRQYLAPATFERWFEELRDVLELVVARDQAGEIVAGAVNFQKGPRLYGRYWGAFEERRHLHFNVCYYHAIEECCRRGLEVFEPGAGGEHKLVRGFAPTLTHSAHHLRDPRLAQAVASYLASERAAVRAEASALADATGLSDR